MLASLKRHKKIVKMLLEDYNADASIQNIVCSPRYIAVLSRWIILTGYLLSLSQDGDTALMLSLILNKDTDIPKLLLANGASKSEVSNVRIFTRHSVHVLCTDNPVVFLLVQPGGPYSTDEGRGVWLSGTCSAAS